LPFIPLSLRRTARTPHATGLARLELGLFTKPSVMMAIYDAIEIYKRYMWVCQREVAPMGSTPSTDEPARPAAYKIVTFTAIPRRFDRFSIDSAIFLIHNASLLSAAALLRFRVLTGAHMGAV
jgi:hypothetical protein